MKISITKKDLWTVPNILCYFRILLVPVFMVLYLTAGSNAAQHYAATGVILVAGFTDFLDGYIARKYHQITELGKIIDPLGDKLMQFAIATVLVINYPLMWTLLSVFLIKELSMCICDAILLAKGEKLNGAKWFGKLSTFVFYIVMSILIVIDTPAINFTNKETVVYVLMAVSTFFLLLSFILYIPVFIQMFKVAFRHKHTADKDNLSDAENNFKE